MRLPHPIRGIFIGPLVVPAAYWFGSMVHAFFSNYHINWAQALRELAVIAAFGVPISYLAELVWLAPIIYVFHRLNWLRAPTLIGAGAVGGMLVGIWFKFDQRFTFFKVSMPLLVAAILGAFAGGATWWAGQAKKGA